MEKKKVHVFDVLSKECKEEKEQTHENMSFCVLS